MSEMDRPCLRNLVDAVDGGEVDPNAANSLGCFAVSRGNIKDFDGEDVESLACGTDICTALAVLKHGPDDPGIQFSSCHDSGKWRCQTIGEKTEVLPSQTDETSCLSTATAYQLSKLGSTRRSEEIDDWLQRKPDEFPTTEGRVALNLAILNDGYSLEIVLPREVPLVRDYYAENTTLTYEDYREATLQYNGSKSMRDWFDTTYTEDVFQQDMANRREVSKMFIEYEARGQLATTSRDITQEYVDEALETHAIRAVVNNFDGKTDVPHVVVVEDVKTVQGGWVVGRYFSPSFYKPSRIVTKRAPDMDSLFSLEYGLALVKPFVPLESNDD